MLMCLYFSVHVGSSYTFTVNYKLQLSILKHIGVIAAQVSIYRILHEFLFNINFYKMSRKWVFSEPLVRYL